VQRLVRTTDSVFQTAACQAKSKSSTTHFPGATLRRAVRRFGATRQRVHLTALAARPNQNSPAHTPHSTETQNSPHSPGQVLAKLNLCLNSSIETNLLGQSLKQWSIRCSYCENYNAGRIQVNKVFAEIVVIKTAALFILLPKQWHRWLCEGFDFVLAQIGAQVHKNKGMKSTGSLPKALPEGPEVIFTNWREILNLA
jgi:hypothetical protein